MKRIKHNILGIITRPQRPSAIITLSSHTPAQGKGVKEGYMVAAGEARDGEGNRRKRVKRRKNSLKVIEQHSSFSKSREEHCKPLAILLEAM